MHDYSINKHFLGVSVKPKGYVEVDCVMFIITNKGTSNYRRLVSPVDICCTCAEGLANCFSLIFWRVQKIRAPYLWKNRSGEVKVIHSEFSILRVETLEQTVKVTLRTLSFGLCYLSFFSMDTYQSVAKSYSCLLDFKIFMPIQLTTIISASCLGPVTWHFCWFEYHSYTIRETEAER